MLPRKMVEMGFPFKLLVTFKEASTLANRASPPWKL